MYKALMLDIDGTIIPYDYDANPSARVTEAIKKAKEKVVISLVTGRSYASVERLVKHLGLTQGYAAVSNGSAVVDLQTHELLYDKPIDKKDSDSIINILLEENVKFYIKKDIYEDSLDRTIYSKNSDYTKTYMIFTIEEFSHDRVKNIFNKFTHIPNVTLHKTRHRDPDKYGFNVTHVAATKAHAIERITTHLNIKRKEVIGVGDSYNDFALLMASGLKVAMGNALPDLKEIADYIAPSVTEDGVASVIEKYILSQ